MSAISYNGKNVKSLAMLRTDEKEKCTFSVLSVRAEVVVVPDTGSSIVDEDGQATQQLCEGLRICP